MREQLRVALECGLKNSGMVPSKLPMVVRAAVTVTHTHCHTVTLTETRNIRPMLLIFVRSRLPHQAIRCTLKLEIPIAREGNLMVSPEV